MDDYRNSIKCKYCGHYDPDQGLCYRYESVGHIDKVSPNSRCKYFMLNDVDMMAKAIMSEQSSALPRRKDGSYVASLEDVPELKAYYREQEEEAERKRKRNWFLFIAALCIFWLIFFWPFFGLLFDILGFIF